MSKATIIALCLVLTPLTALAQNGFLFCPGFGISTTPTTDCFTESIWRGAPSAGGARWEAEVWAIGPDIDDACSVEFSVFHSGRTFHDGLDLPASCSISRTVVSSVVDSFVISCASQGALLSQSTDYERIVSLQYSGAVVNQTFTFAQSIFPNPMIEHGANCNDSTLSVFGNSARLKSCGFGGDIDFDGRCNFEDSCVDYPQIDDSLDSNSDGRLNECQCGDGTGDGHISNVDIGVVALCANGVITCDSTIVDFDGDGSTTALDIGGIVAIVRGQISTLAADCTRL